MIGSVRRYCLLKRRAHFDGGDLALAGVWRAKQEAEPGTTLPSDFPLRSLLASAGYVASEDLDGADAEELNSAGLSSAQADTVLAAFAAL